MTQFELTSLPYEGQGGIFLCLQGSAQVLINNHVYHLTRGSLHIISPVLFICRLNQTPDFEGIHLTSPLATFYPVFENLTDLIVRLDIRNNPCIALDESTINFICHRHDAIEAKRSALEQTQNTDHRWLLSRMITLLLQETMLEVLTLHHLSRPVPAAPPTKGDETVYRFLQTLFADFKEHRQVAYYAARAHLSTGHFSSIIRRATGQSPSFWIETVTILHAKQLLASTSLTVKQIAAKLGFPEQFTFRKYFSSHAHMPPTTYRRSLRQQQPPTTQN